MSTLRGGACRFAGPPADAANIDRLRAVMLDRGIETSPPLPGDCERHTHVVSDG